MNASRIFSRSLEITWKLKFLWLYGFVMALTASAGGGGFNFGNFNGQGFSGRFGAIQGNFFRIEPAIGVLLLCLVCVTAVVGLVLTFYVRFIARAAMVTAVRDEEANDTPTLGRAWREGRPFYLRLLGLGFLVNVPLLILSAVLILAALIPLIGGILLAVNSRNNDLNFAPAVGTLLLGVGLVCGAILVVAALGVIIHPLYEFAVRSIVLEDERTVEGIRRGVERVRENASKVLGLYLLLIGARLGWGLVEAIIVVPGAIVLGVVVLGALQYGFGTVLLLSLLIGIPLGLVAAFLEGLFQVFESSAWTQAFQGLTPQTAPVQLPPTEPAAATPAPA